MTGFLIALLVVVCILLITLTIKQNRMSDLETEILLLKEEREDLTSKVNLLQRNIESIKSTYEEVTKIEKAKEENKRQKNEPPPTGDSSARLDRLNKLSDKRD